MVLNPLHCDSDLPSYEALCSKKDSVGTSKRPGAIYIQVRDPLNSNSKKETKILQGADSQCGYYHMVFMLILKHYGLVSQTRLISSQE